MRWGGCVAARCSFVASVLVPLILVFPSPISLSSHFLALLPVMDTTSIIQRETDEASARHIAHDVLPQPVVAISQGLSAKREDMISNHILIARDEDGRYPDSDARWPQTVFSLSPLFKGYYNNSSEWARRYREKKSKTNVIEWSRQLGLFLFRSCNPTRPAGSFQSQTTAV